MNMMLFYLIVGGLGLIVLIPPILFIRFYLRRRRIIREGIERISRLSEQKPSGGKKKGV